MPLNWNLDPPIGFVFDDVADTAPTLEADIGERWKEIPHASTRTRGFVLLPGESLLSPIIEVGADHEVLLEAMRAVEDVSPDGLELSLIVEVEGEATPRTLCAMALGTWQVSHHVGRLQASLGAFAGQRVRVRVICGPGPDHDPRGDWAAVCAWVIAPMDRVGLAAASSQYAWRRANEIGKFQDVYTQPMYAERKGGDGSGAGGRSVEAAPGGGRLLRGHSEDDALTRLEAFVPEAGESAFDFAHRMLYSLLPRRAPDFAERLPMRSPKAPPRMLSLCAGEAGIEASLLHEAGSHTELTLLDINRTLLRRAASRFPPQCVVRLWEGDVRDLGADAGGFDIISFVSGLHHVVDLEAVLSQCQRLLSEDGELWLIGEQVGRNGNRLWPEALDAANRVFATLPKRLRKNKNTGIVDAELPNFDYASSCFEGIRSQEIPTVVGRFFVPVDEHLCDCFMWRLVDAAYAANFDLSSVEDLGWLRVIVAAEYGHWRDGGRATQLNGVYRSKLGSSAFSVG